MKKRYVAAASLCLIVVIVSVIFFISGKNSGTDMSSGVSEDKYNAGSATHFPARELDRIYIYNDSSGNTVTSEKQPEGVDYRVLERHEIYRKSESRETVQARMKTADKARKIMRGQGFSDEKINRYNMPHSEENSTGEDLSGASASQLLERSNALRKKQNRPDD